MRGPGTPLLAAALLLLAACGPAAAIFQDHAGQYDWLKQHVGRVSAAVLSGGSDAAIYAASADAGTLAALAHADGRLLWRRVLAEGDGVTRLVAAGRQVLTLSAGGTQLMAWDAATGAAAWAADLAPDAAADLAVLGRNAVAVSVGGHVKAFGLGNGKQLWSTAVGGNGAKLFASADGLWAAAADGTGVAAALLATSDGSVLRQLSLSSGEQLSGSQLVVGNAAVAALSADASSLCAAALQEGASRLSCQRVASLLPAGIKASSAQLLAGSCASHAVLQAAGGAALLSLGDSGGAAVVKFVPGATASGCFAGADPAALPLVAFATPSPAGLAVQVLSAADGSAAQPAVTVASLAPRRSVGTAVPVAALFGGAVQAGKAGQQEFRQLVLFDDDSLALMVDGKRAWLRHEEVASIQDVLFTDLPAPTPENEAAWAASQPGWREVLAAQVLQLKVQASQLANLQLASPEEQQRLEHYKALTSDKLRPTRDPDGFRKQIVVLTASGKVLALHNGDGRVLWELDFGRATGLRKLVLWRVPHDVQHDIQVAAVATGGSSSRVIVINAHTGAVEQSLEFKGEAAQLLHLPQALHDGSADQHAYVLVPAAASEAAKVLPDTEEARAAFQAARSSLSFWRVDEAAGSIQGLGFTKSGQVEERWSAVLAPAGTGQRILSVAAHSPGEAVASPARVLGDGSLKFKYLNPNTLLAVVGLPAGEAPAAGATTPAKLTAVLLDAVTGRVLFSQAHEGATGPVHAVLSESMAAYHFWSVDAHRWQVAAVELYDASPTTLRVSDLAFSVPNVTASSWDASPVEAAATTLLSRLAVNGLAVTRSARGNTAKQVIMLTPAGRVYLLDRRFLDPRRPVIPPGGKPTAIQAAEGLPPFAPELPLVGQQYATLDHQVARLRGVAVEPAVLESTQLMLAHGLDLFYNRLTPSKSFDRLPDDFPFALLTLIVVGMTGATVVLSQLQTRALVKRKWQ